MTAMTTAEYARTQASTKVQAPISLPTRPRPRSPRSPMSWAASDADIAHLESARLLLPTARAAHAHGWELEFEADGGAERIARAIAAGHLHFLTFDGERRSLSGWVWATSEDEAYAKISLAL